MDFVIKHVIIRICEFESTDLLDVKSGFIILSGVFSYLRSVVLEVKIARGVVRGIEIVILADF